MSSEMKRILILIILLNCTILILSGNYELTVMIIRSTDLSDFAEANKELVNFHPM